MRQNPFFFSKAESTTNDFKGEDLINTMQIIGEGWAPLVYGFPPLSDPSSLSRADLKGLQGTSESRGKGELEDQRNCSRANVGMKLGDTRTNSGWIHASGPFCAIPVLRYLFFPVWSGESCATASAHRIALTFWLAGRRMMGSWANMDQPSCLDSSYSTWDRSQLGSRPPPAAHKHRGNPTQRRHRGTGPSIYNIQKSPDMRKERSQKVISWWKETVVIWPGFSRCAFSSRWFPSLVFLQQSPFLVPRDVLFLSPCMNKHPYPPFL